MTLPRNNFHFSSSIFVGLVLLKVSSKPWSTRASRTETCHNAKFYFPSNFSIQKTDAIIGFVMFLFKLEPHHATVPSNPCSDTTYCVKTEIGTNRSSVYNTDTVGTNYQK
jgi:hypothetical protein